MEQAKRRPGRPPVERRRIPMAMRITPKLRDQLVARAEAKGRSITQEMELLLEQALSTEEMLGGKDIFAILMIIGRAMRETGTTAGFSSTFTLEGANRWLLNPYAYDQAVKAAAAVLEAMRPPGNIEMPKGMSGVMGSFDLSALAARLGEGFANAALGSVAGEEISAAGVEWAKSVVSRLPPEAIEAIRSNRQRNRS